MEKPDLRDYLGQMVEHADGNLFGRVVLAERDGHGLALTAKVAGPNGGGGERHVTLIGSDFGVDGKWRLLGHPPKPREVGLSSCLRCRRMNFGPCISLTCVDLQGE